MKALLHKYSRNFMIVMILLLGLIGSSCTQNEESMNTISDDINTEETADDSAVNTEEEHMQDYNVSYPRNKGLIRNPELWKTPSLENGEFVLTIEFGTIGNYQPKTLLDSIEAYDLGTIDGVQPTAKSSAAEWGVVVVNYGKGSKDAAGRLIRQNRLVSENPQTREEALEMIQEFLINQYVKDEPHPWYSMNGHYCWHHYAGETGFDVIGSELGENVYSYQLHYAMCRGAARQYGAAWFIDFSSWHGPGILDYSDHRIWGGYSGIHNGHSMSLIERTFVASYMSGADGVVAEAGAALSFYDTIDPETNLYKLSPYGQVCQDFRAFTKANPDVGITYTPIAIVLDYYHGMGHPFVKKAFGQFSYTDGDFMTYNLVDLLWDDAWYTETHANEVGTLLNNAYGDNFDILLQNASPELLDTYPVLILSGDIKLSDEEIAKYRNYVHNGGTLVLNTVYLPYFPAYQQEMTDDQYTIHDGEGTVIVYGPDYSVQPLDGIIRELVGRYVPFTYSENIQSILNVKDNVYYLTLINNEGVIKMRHEPVVIDQSAAKNMTVQYTGTQKIKSVYDIYREKEMTFSDGIFEITLGPGEIAILKIETAAE